MLSGTDDYPRWWPWLGSYQADGLHPGAVARFTVRAPLPYRLHVHVEVTEVVPERLVVVRVGGDLEGPARLELAPARAGTDARLAWEVELRRPLLLALEGVARPAMVWGHDTIVALGLRQFRRRALGE